MTIRQTIMTEIENIAAQQGKRLPPLSDDLPMVQSGLDSLCIAILVASLEDRLGVDPFRAEGSGYPVTLGDFVRLYEHAAV